MTLQGDLDLRDIVSVDFPETQFFKEVIAKRQIVLHHSAGWDNARNMFAGWRADKARVATCVGIVDDGTIYQIFRSQFWAWHVNIMRNSAETRKKFPLLFTMFNAKNVEQRTIGIEVCSWGGLKEIDGKFHPWASGSVTGKGKDITVDEKKVIHYEKGFRGYNYFERYTDQEIEQLWRLVRYWCKLYSIPTNIKRDPFEVNEFALKGTPGVYTHASFRDDKNDMHPQPELIEMLKAL